MTRAEKKYYEQKVIPFPKAKALPYPNAADRNYKIGKLLDIILSFAICLGALTVLVYLMLL